MIASMNDRIIPQYKRESDILKELEYQFRFNFTLEAYSPYSYTQAWSI